MAASPCHDELKKEIDALVAENEELKQLVQLLIENQELKCILQQQYNESTPLPAPEGPADDCLPPGYAQPDTQWGSGSPDTPWGSGFPGTPWGGGSPGSSNCPRGYCYECTYPWHPHVPPAPPTNADSTSGTEEGGTGSQGTPSTTPTDGSQQQGEGGSDLVPLSPQTDSSAASSGAAVPARVRWEPLPSPGFQSQPISMPAFLPSPLESGPLSPGFPPMFPSDWTFPGPQQLLEVFAPLVPQMDSPIRCRHISMLSADPQSFPSPVPWPDFMPMAASTPFSPMQISSFPNAFPPFPPVQALARACRPSPLQLPPPGALSPSPFAPQQLPPSQGQGPYFSYPSPFALMKCANLAGPEAQGQAQGQAQAQATPTDALQNPPDATPKERRSGERHALSMTASKTSKDAKQANTERIVGEIAFQLDRRILATIFPDRVRLYGFTVSNIPEKITQNDPMAPLTEEQRKGMMERYNDIMNQLKPLGYDPNVHPTFTEYVVNTYGILQERPDTTTSEGDAFNNLEYLQNVVNTVVPAEKLDNFRILLACLSHLSKADGKPLFIW